MPNAYDTNIDNEVNVGETFSDALDNLISADKGSKNQRINSPLQELSVSDLEYSILVRQKYGLIEEADFGNKEELTSSGEEWATLIIILEKISKKFLDDLVMGRGGCVEEGHALLKPFLALLEVILVHRIRKNQH